MLAVMSRSDAEGPQLRAVQGQWLDEAHQAAAQQGSQHRVTSPCQPAHARQLPEDCSSPESASSSRMQSADGSPRTHVVCRICDCTVLLLFLPACLDAQKRAFFCNTCRRL